MTPLLSVLLYRPKLGQHFRPPKVDKRETSYEVSFLHDMSRGKQAQFYKTALWVECRKNYLKRVGGLCEKCKKKGLIVPAEIVHHKIHLNAENINDPTISLNPDNLEALCRKCHGDEHGTPKRFDVLADGSVVAR